MEIASSQIQIVNGSVQVITDTSDSKGQRIDNVRNDFVESMLNKAVEDKKEVTITETGERNQADVKTVARQFVHSLLSQTVEDRSRCVSSRYGPVYGGSGRRPNTSDYTIDLSSLPALAPANRKDSDAPPAKLSPQNTSILKRLLTSAAVVDGKEDEKAKKAEMSEDGLFKLPPIPIWRKRLQKPANKSSKSSSSPQGTSSEKVEGDTETVNGDKKESEGKKQIGQHSVGPNVLASQGSESGQSKKKSPFTCSFGETPYKLDSAAFRNRQKRETVQSDDSDEDTESSIAGEDDQAQKKEWFRDLTNDEFVDGLMNFSQGAADYSSALTTAKVGDFLSQGGDLLNVSSDDLNDFVDTFEQSTSLDILENIVDQNNNSPTASSATHRNPWLGNNTQYDLSKKGTDAIDLMKKGCDGLQLSPATREKFKQFLQSLQTRVDRIQNIPADPIDLTKIVQKQPLFVDGANDVTAASTSSSTIVLSSSDEDDITEQSRKQVNVNKSGDVPSTKRKVPVKRKSQGNVSEESSDSSSSVTVVWSERNQPTKKRKVNKQPPNKKTSSAQVSNILPANDVEASWSNDEVVAGSNDTEFSTIEKDSLQPFDFTTLLSGLDSTTGISNYDEFSTAVTYSSTPKSSTPTRPRSATATNNNDDFSVAVPSSSTAVMQGTAEANEAYDDFSMVLPYSTKPGTKASAKARNVTDAAKPKRGRATKRSQADGSDGKTPVKRARAPAVKKNGGDNATGKKPVANRKRKVAETSTTDEECNSSTSSFRQKNYPKIFGEMAAEEKKAAPKRRRTKQYSDDAWILPDLTDESDPEWRAKNNCSLSAEATGSLDVTVPYEEEYFDVITTSCVADDQLTQNEEEYNSTVNFSVISRDSDPVWSTTEDDGDQESESVEVEVDQQDTTTTSEELDREMRSIEG